MMPFVNIPGNVDPIKVLSATGTGAGTTTFAHNLGVEGNYPGELYPAVFIFAITDIVGSFSALQVNLEWSPITPDVGAAQYQTVGTWTPLTSPVVYFACSATGLYRLNCTSFVGGTSFNVYVSIASTMPQATSSGGGGGSVTQGTVPWADNITQVAGVTLGATAVVNYGSTPAAAPVPGVNAFVTNAASIGGGVQFADNAVSSATPTGTLSMGWDSVNSKIRALKVESVSQNLLMLPGAATAVSASAWTTATATGTVQYTNGLTTPPAPLGVGSIVVELAETNVSGGQITFEGSYDGTTWNTIPSGQVLSPINFSITNANPVNLNGTSQTFLLVLNGYQLIRVRLSSAITGTGATVSFSWNANFSINPVLVSQTLAVKGTGTNNQLSVNIGAVEGIQLTSFGIPISDGTNVVTVKPASTAAGAVDTALVVTLSPNTPLPAGTNVIGHVIVDSGAITVSGSVDVTDRAARLVGIVYGSQSQQLKQTATNFNLQVELATGGTLYDARQIRALTSADVVTANQGTANTLANKWPVQVTDGTNVMPTADVAARAQFHEITDGTNTSAVKAASTAAVSADPALVITPSPNGRFRTADGAGNPLTTSSPSTGVGVNPLDSNLVSSRGTQFTQAGYVDIKVSDGTNGTVAVKAASVAAVVTDPALVVALSPNTSVPSGMNAIGSVAITPNTSLLDLLQTLILEVRAMKAALVYAVTENGDISDQDFNPASADFQPVS